MIYLITGDGGGKTTQSLGMALRAVGHRKRVVIVQFMKASLTGEVLIAKKLSPYYKIYQFGRDRFVNLKNPSDHDKKLAVEALAFAEQALKKKPFMLVLDEVCLAAAVGLVKVNAVLELIKKAGKTHIVLTGRKAPKGLVKAADIVSVCKDLTKPKKRIPARKGVEY